MKRLFQSSRTFLSLTIPAIFLCLSGHAGTPVSTYDTLASALALSPIVTNFVNNSIINVTTAGETFQITRNTTIDAGTNNVVIDGNNAARLFVVHTNCQLILANLQLRNALSLNGGAILNSGALVISNCIFLNNSATNAMGLDGIDATSTNAPDGTAGVSAAGSRGGAIYSFGPLFVYYSVFATNSAVGGAGGSGGAGLDTTGQVYAGLGGNAGDGGYADGGAIFSSASNNVLFATEFLGNTSSAGAGGTGGATGTNPLYPNYAGASGQGGTGGAAAGGAVFMTGSLYTSNCLFVSNTALGGDSSAAAVAFNGSGFDGTAGGLGLGGGLFVSVAAPIVRLENSIFYANICAGGAGATAAATDSTGGNGGAALGGGVDLGAVSSVVRNCTIATNFLFAGAGGVDNGTNGAPGGVGEAAGWDLCCGAGTVRLANSILSGNSGSASGVTDGGYNLCSDDSLAQLYATTRVGINPHLDSALSAQGPALGPVGIGGDFLMTLAVLAGPATNVIPGVPGISFPATDERLILRATPAAIGAFEVHVLAVTPSAPATITQEPQFQTAVLGEPALLNVNASPNPNDPNPLGYQWQLNGLNLSDGVNFGGVNSPTLSIESVAAVDLGAYQVIVSPSVFDSVTNSSVAYLLVDIRTSITAQPASRLNVPDGSVVKFAVTVNGSPPFYYQWRTNGTPLTDGNEFSGSSTPILTINPTTLSDAASYTVVITNYYTDRNVTSMVARLTVVADNTRPSVVISTPTPNARTTNNLISGTTTDNAQVTNVFCWITNIFAGESSVFVTNAVLSETGTTTKTWAISNALAPGTNFVVVRSVDYSSNASPFVRREFFYVVPSRFSLSYNGPGSATARIPFAGAAPPINGAILNVGEGYTLVANPDHDCLLTNWTSANFTSNASTLHFTMTPNLSIQATFVISPFLSVAGNYNGLFFETNNDFNPETAGMLNGLAVGPLGGYSGKVLLGATAWPITGAFDIFGRATNHLARAAAKGGPLGLEMDLDYTTGKISGAVSGTSAGWASPLHAEENLSTPSGSFESTIILTPSTNAIGDVPPGFGYVLITNHNGSLILAGALPDGTPLSQAVPLGKFGNVPLYEILYGHAGLVLGWVTLTNATPEAPAGLMWARPSVKPSLYPAGFTNLLNAQGSPWIDSPDFSIAGTLTISDDSSNLTYPALISKDVITTSANLFPKGSVNPKNGLVKITFESGIKKVALTGYGAILHNSSVLGGYFLTKTNAGVISLQPNP